jgi:hypothetical protein
LKNVRGFDYSASVSYAGLKTNGISPIWRRNKRIKVEEIGEKGRLELIKIIRTVFEEEEVLKCNSEQLDSLLRKIQTILDSKTMSQNEESVKAKEKSEQELKQLKTQYEKLLVEQEKLKDKINTVQTQNETTEDITINSESVTQQDKPQSAFLNMKACSVGNSRYKDKSESQGIKIN